MVQAPQRTAFSGPTLIRLLARLADVEVTESRQSLSDRLSQWIHWTDAIALSTALNGNPPGVPSGYGAQAVGSAEETECARVRSTLVNAIVGGGASAADKRHGSAQTASHGASMNAAVDYPAFRQIYLSMQQTMETGIGNLRGRLRAKLAARTPAMSRLAEVDAVMERALSPRERSLLATVPGLLGGHFERLRKAGRETLADADADADAQAPEDAPTIAPGAWLNVFRKDMQSVLLAELDLRFQPVEGLLAALRTR
ncbi:hypothetical protein SBC1_37210 (plasmid) [Caballeronia sp. SBC1]|uniref:DUF3348 domain-containing protein n=1 Tax=unclassified Caballeronia TaxID=2646786 RepID=UPI0013E1EF1D|nr:MULTISPECIES: DUF3348 domain-containing protein [unclassified Caballeronia]QIE27003.1 hypothetical protein SBC2_50730 [Caballeronia sp. SBC2]QIN63681.1 hypothetical protein SBC1_37210 [Caballeronia sp. SBC1]